MSEPTPPIVVQREIEIQADQRSVWDHLTTTDPATTLLRFFDRKARFTWEELDPAHQPPGSAAARRGGVLVEGRRFAIDVPGIFRMMYFGSVDALRAPDLLRLLIISAEQRGGIERLLEFGEEMARRLGIDDGSGAARSDRDQAAREGEVRPRAGEMLVEYRVGDRPATHDSPARGPIRAGASTWLSLSVSVPDPREALDGESWFLAHPMAIIMPLWLGRAMSKHLERIRRAIESGDVTPFAA